jgi:clindamycin resistance transfer factor btgB
LIVSRKDQSNKKKLSPLTNHKNTKKGTVKGGFDRKDLFQQAELGFDRLFNYDKQLTESFKYYNAMKNGSISDQLSMQERQIASKKTGLYADKQDEQVENKVIYKQADNLLNNTENKQSFNLPDLGLSSALSLLTPEPNSNDEQQIPVKRKKKKSQRGFKW